MRIILALLVFCTACAQNATPEIAACTQSDSPEIAACTQSDSPEIAYERGITYNKNNNFDKARVCFEIAAEQGHADAQNQLGLSYKMRDPQKAVEFFNKAIEQGNAKAMHNLGHMYRTGAGIPQDRAKARALFDNAVSLGYNGSLVSIAYMYAEDEDYSNAIKWYLKSYEQGNELGLNIAAALYVTKYNDFDSAKALLQEPAKQGNDKAQSQLGHLIAFSQPEPEKIIGCGWIYLANDPQFTVNCNKRLTAEEQKAAKDYTAKLASTIKQ